MNTADSPRELEGRVILVTGAAGTLGRTATLACARAGATVILLGRTVARLEKVYDEVLAAGGPTPAIYPMDLAGAREEDYADLAATITSEFGTLHGLLHAAADFAYLTPMIDLSSTDWQRVMQVNLNAPFLLTRAVLPVMAEADDASIVFITDSAARLDRAYWGAYGVSKVAVEGLARILADEWEGSGKIRVNILLPGPMKSPIRRRAFPGEDAAGLPAAEFLRAACVYALGPQSRGVTGRIIDHRLQAFDSD